MRARTHDESRYLLTGVIFCLVMIPARGGVPCALEPGSEGPGDKNPRRAAPKTSSADSASSRPTLASSSLQAEDTRSRPLVFTIWDSYTTRDGLPDDRIRAVRVFGDQVWVGTDGGLALFAGGEWKKWTGTDGLPARVVSAIDVDPRTRDVWIGTWGGGLVRFSSGRFDRFDQFNSGLAGNLVFAVKVVGNRVWAATNGGLSSFAPLDDAWELFFARRADGPETAVTTLAFDGEDLYAGIWRGGVRRFNAQRGEWLPVSVPVELKAASVGPLASQPAGGKPACWWQAGLPVQSVDASPRHEGPDTTVGIASAGQSLWWATQTILFRRDAAGTWGKRRLARICSPLPESDQSTVPYTGLPPFTYCLAARGAGEVWLGTEAGPAVLVDWSSDTWVTYRSGNGGRSCEVALQSTGRAPQTRWIAPGLPSNRITTIAFAPDGVWIGTARGLAHGTGLTSWETLPPTGGDQQTVEKISRSAAGENDSTRAHLQPSREKASPAAIAVLGPYNRTISLPGERPGSARRGGRADLLAVQLAIEHINTIRRTRGQEPFELAVRYPGYAEYGWGTPEDEFARTAANDNVLGIVGFLRPDNSIAEAVVTHTDIPVVNAAPSPREKGGVQTANPWIFRCWGDLPRQHRLLLDHVFDRLGHTRIAALHTPDEDAQRHLAWWRSHAGSRGRPLVGEVSYDGTSQGLAEALEALRSWEPDVVLTWCDADTSAAILQQMRRMRMNQLLIGGPQIVTDEFVTQVQTGLPAGTTPGSVIALYPTIRADTARPPSTFITQYAERGLGGPAASVSGTALEQWHGAYRSFDAANHLLEAIDLSSANREAVRRTLRMMRESATGEHHYERLHPRTQLTFARLEAGAWVFQAIDPPK